MGTLSSGYTINSFYRLMTIPTWERYLDYISVSKRLNVEKHNLNTYRYRYKKIKEYFENREFNRDNCERFFFHLKESGSSNSTLNNYLKMCKHITKMLQNTFLSDFPYWDKTPLTQVDPLTPDEIIRIAETPIDSKMNKYGKIKNHRLKTVVYLLALGIRNGELRNLKWEDVREDHLIIRVGKTASSARKIYLPDKIRTLISQLTKYPHGYLFGSATGPMHRDTINDELRLKAKSAGIKKYVHAHLFRHSFITNAIRQNQSIAAIADHVGHASWETTRQYTHLNMDDRKKLFDHDPVYAIKKENLSVKERLLKVIEESHDEEKLKAVLSILSN